MQVFLNTQNSNYNSHQTFKGILVKNEGMKKILTRHDIVELKKVNTRKVSLLCMQKAVDMAECEFFQLHPECKRDGMKKLCKDAIRRKAKELLDSANKQKEMDFEVVPTYEHIDGFDNYYTDFHSYNFPIPFKVGFGKHTLNKSTDIDNIMDRFEYENNESLKNTFDSYTSTKAAKDFTYNHINVYEDACYRELIYTNDYINSLLCSPLHRQQMEQVRGKISKKAADKPRVFCSYVTPEPPEMHKSRGHYEEINDEFGTERVWVSDK